MCNFWTCILTEDGRVHSNAQTSSHDDLITFLKLDDGSPGAEYTIEAIKQRRFVRLEVTPRTQLEIASKDKKKWVLKVDEEETLPGWFLSKRKEHEAAVWKEWHKVMTKTLWKLRIERLPKLLAEIKAIPYFTMNSPPAPKWKMHYGETWVAAEAVARDDRAYALGDVAWNAAWEAADVETQKLIGTAAWDAADDVMRNTARDLVRSIGNEPGKEVVWLARTAIIRDAILWLRFKSLPAASLAEIPPKHVSFVNARMDVWKKGYGLMGTIDGVLQCYALSGAP